MKRAPRAKDRLADLNVRPSKERGQNFLIDDGALSEILEFGRPQSGERLVEIGPGLGALTKHLAKIAPLTAIEIEEKFCAPLRALSDRITVINSDFRAVDLAEIGSELTVFGNVPYSFSTDIIFHLIHHAATVRRAVLMLQKEFADRLASPPGSKAYGTLSVACQLRCDVLLGPVISGSSFHPPTEVDSRVIELIFLKEPRYPVGDLFHFRRTVQAAFHSRRKKISNSMRASGTFPGDAIDKALAVTGIDPNRRGETLSVEEFSRLACALPM